MLFQMKCLQQRFIFLSVIFGILIFIFYQGRILEHHIFHSILRGYAKPVQTQISEQNSKNLNCPSVLQTMKHGSWLPHKMTHIQRQEIEKFLEDARSAELIPQTLERLDKKCGKEQMPGPRIYFRALCNPRGSTPCCENNHCVKKSVAECNCTDCLDERQSIHAEYSQWIPTDKSCSIKYYNSDEACRLLSGKTILLVGDSFLRHLYYGLLSFLRNDYQTGALERNPHQNITKQCKGMYMYTETVCRHYLDRQPLDICSGNVKVILKQYYSLNFADEFEDYVINNITKNEAILIVCGIGHHAYFQSEKIMKDYLMPVLDILKTRSRSKLLFALAHSTGLLRRSPTQNHILKFNSEMGSVLKSWNIPVFDTGPMTENIVSFDGIHYGLGLNRKKVQFLLNYIQELKDSGDKLFF